MALSKSKALKPSRVVKPKRDTRRTTLSHRQHRFQPFSERISKLKIDPIRRRRNAEADEELEVNRETYFGKSLAEWRDLNMSQTFTSFAKEVAQFSDGLPSLLYSQDRIMDILIRYIELQDAFAMEPLLSLLSSFARDLDTRFERHFERSVRVVASVASKHSDPAVIEWSFTCLAWLFKYLSRLLTPDLRPVYDLMSPYLGKTSQKPFIIRFAAESMSFLFRKAAAAYQRDQTPLELIVSHLLQDCSGVQDTPHSELYFQGVNTLLTEAIKGVQGGIHSTGGVIIQTLVRHARNSPSSATSTILDGTLTSLIHFTNAKSFQPILSIITDECSTVTQDCDDESVYFKGRLLFVVVSVRKGTRISDWSAMLDTISILIEAGRHAQQWTPRTRSLLLTNLALSLQYAPIDKILPTLRLLETISEDKWSPSFIRFCEYSGRFERARFRDFVLPQLQRWLLQDRPIDPTQALTVLPGLLRAGVPLTIRCSSELQADIIRKIKAVLSVGDHETCEHAITPCYFALQALPAIQFSAENERQISQLLLEIVRVALQTNSGRPTLFQDFGLGICLQTWLELSNGSIVDKLIPQLCAASARFVNLPLFWANLSKLLKGSGITELTQITITSLEPALISALSLSSHDIRESVLRIIQTCYVAREQQVPECLLLAALVDSTPITLDTIRSISLNIRKIGSGYESVVSDPLLSRALPTYCFGLLHLRLAQAWADAIGALAQMSTTSVGEEVIVSLAQRWLETDPETSEVELLNPILDHNTPGFLVMSDFECSNLARVSAIAKQVFDEPQFGYADAGEQMKHTILRIPTTPTTVRSQALRVLDKLPQVAEKRSRMLVPILLSWAGMDVSFDGDVSSSSRWSRKDSKALLDVFAQFTNPKVLFMSADVHRALLQLCANGDVEIQRAALKAILSWKDPTIKRYEEHLSNFLDDARFREEISVFLQDETEDGLRSSDFPTVMPLLLRVLYGRLVGGSKDGQQARRRAVFVAISRFGEQVLDMFTDIALSSAMSVVPVSDDSFRLEAATEFQMPSRQQLGMLNMLNDMLQTLGSALQPFSQKLLDPVVLCTVLASRKLDQHSRSEDAISDQSLLRSIRQTGTQCLGKLFASTHILKSRDYGKIVVDELLAPRLTSFAAENSQGVSSILQLLSVWSSSPRYRDILWTCNDRLLICTADLLCEPAAKDDVKLFVLEQFIDNLFIDVSTAILPLSYVSAFVESIGKLLTTRPSKNLLDACVRTLTQLAQHLTQQDLARRLVEICGGLLTQPSLVVSQSTKTGLLRTISPLLDLQDIAARTDIYDAVCGLFSRLSGVGSRAILSEVFNKICRPSTDRGQAARICHDLNAVDPARLDGQDHVRLEKGFSAIYDHSNTFNGEQWTPILHNCLFFIRDEDDSVNRASAAKALELFILASVTPISPQITNLLKVDLFAAIQRGMKARSELVRAEHLRLLGEVIRRHPDWSDVNDMQGLVAGDDTEASVFVDLLHIQQHKRLSALRRLGAESRVSSKNVTRLFLPLLEHFVFDQSEGDAGRALADQTVQTIGHLARRLRWSDLRSTLSRYYGYLKTKVDLKKLVLRLIGVLIDGLTAMHSSGAQDTNNKDSRDNVVNDRAKSKLDENRVVVPQNRVKVILNEFLPPLLGYLHHKDESTVDRRVAVAISIVKLLRMLPEIEFAARLAPTLTDVAHILKSRDLEAREQTRKTLSTILSLVGPQYLGFIIKELRGALQRGYQLHVLSYTVHHLLVTNDMAFHFGEVDDCLSELTNIILDDIFGVTGQEKDAEGYNSAMKEVKSSKSYDTMEILARMTSIGKLGQLVLPISAMLQEKLDAKMVKKIDDLLSRIRRGVDQNSAANSRDMLIFCHEIVRQVYAQQKLSLSNGGIQDWKMKKYLAQSRPRAIPGVKGATTSYTFKLTAFAMNLVRKIIRRHEDLQTPANMAGFLPVIGDGLVAQVQEVKVESAKLLATIIHVPLPEIDSNIPVYLKEALGMIKGSSSTTTDSARAGLELITAVLREKREAEIKERDIGILLKALKPDLDEPDRQGIIFRFLRAVLGRKIVIPEVYEVLDDVARIMINNSDETVRQSARAAYVQFIIDFPQGKDRWAKTVGFLVTNMQFEHVGGRKSVLEVIHTLLGRLSDEVVQHVLLGLFVGLVPRVVGDPDASCREMARVLIGRILERGDEERRARIKEMMVKWLGHDRKLAIRQAAVVCWNINVKAGISKRTETAMLLKEIATILDPDAATSDKLLDAALQLFSTLCEMVPLHAFSSDAERIWILILVYLDSKTTILEAQATTLLNMLFNNIASNVSKTELGLSAAGLEASGGLVINAQYLRRGCIAQIRALRKIEPNTSILAENIVRNLVFLGRTFGASGLQWTTSAEDEESEEDNGDDPAPDSGLHSAKQPGKHNTTATGYLFSRLAFLARREDAPAVARTAALQTAAALVSIVPQSTSNLQLLIKALYVLTDPSIPQPPGSEYVALSDKARELLDLIQDKVGAEVYVKMLGEARKVVNERRDDRRRKRRVEAVSQPERWAREKRRRYEVKKSRSKVKADFNRGQRRGW